MFQFPIRSLFVLSFLLTVVPSVAFSAPKYKTFGVNFSPYMGTQNPNNGVTIPSKQITSRLSSIKGYSDWIRTFSVTHGMETAGALGHKAGFKVALGAWLGSEKSQAGIDANALEISNLIAAAKRGEADLLIVGSEVLLRGDLSESKLLEYIQAERSAVPAGIPVMPSAHSRE